jgi:hypothetical protein
LTEWVYIATRYAFTLNRLAGEIPMNRKLWLSGLIGAVGLAMVLFGVETVSSGQNKAAKSPGAGATVTIAGT